MAQALGAIGSAAGGILGSGGITGALGDVFGRSGVETTTGTERTRGRRTEGLEISPEAIDKIIKDVLGSADGLASIFGGEQATGLYGASATAQEAGDLVSQLVGEIAKLQARKVSTEDTTVATDKRTAAEEAGLLESAKPAVQDFLRFADPAIGTSKAAKGERPGLLTGI